MRLYTELLTLLLLATLAKSTQILRCSNTDNACHCSEFGEIEIQCPKFDPRVYVRIQPNLFLNFECENSTDADYNLIPEYHLTDPQKVKITKCPLPEGRSIASYLKNLHVNKIIWLQIVSGGVNSRMPIESVHMKGFEDITRFHLSAYDNEFHTLPSNFFASMTKITWITMRVGHIQLPIDLFYPLENLEFLELGHNKMTSLEPGLLKNNKKLARLNLWGNSLRNLDKQAFFGLENLEELDLSTNGMEYLEPDLFKYIPNLMHLNLGGNNFASLPDGLFAFTPKLTTFRMLENRVTMDTLPNEFLANMTMLTEVLIKCGLRKIPSDIFEGSTNITTIKLSGNELEDLPVNLIHDQEKLTMLSLSNNYLTEIPEEFFVRSKKLKELQLNENRIQKLSKYLFNSLHELEKLLLNNNQLKFLEGGTFSELKTLKTLDLQNNQLKFEAESFYIDGISEIQTMEVASRFQQLSSLEHLNLQNNSISTIFEDYTLTNLKTLDLSFNKITHLAKTDLQFGARNELTIDLRHNKIEEIDFKPETDDNSNKMNILLSHNPVVCDCRILHFVKFIKDRTKSNINLKIDELTCAGPEGMTDREVTSLHPMELVCTLDDANSLAEKRCPSSCTSCLVRPEDRSLLLTCLGNTSMSQLPIAENLNLNQTELKIEGQNLTETPNTLTLGYQQVTKLLLGNNNIKYVSDLPPNLIELDLKDNEIEALNETVLAAFNNSRTLQKLKLSGNPWRCDCGNLQFINFVQRSYMNITDYSELKCDDGQLISELTASGLCSEENLMIIIASVVFAILSLIIGVLAALYYKYQKQIKMWLYAHNLCLWFVTEEELDKDKTYDAFVSYAHQDGDFISDHLVPQLENCLVPYKLCLHEREFLPGLEISTQISNSINDSKRTIVVMSQHYLNSNWAQWEFRVAQSHAATEKRSRIIVILYSDIGDINKLEPDIRDYLKLNTYVKWGDKWFWEKLRYAMPHVKGQGPLDKSKGLVKTAIKSSVDDKLELIKPVSVTPPQLTTPPAEQIANPLVQKLNAKNAANNHNNSYNGHINGAFVINTSSRQSDV